jgi:uncharacterized protein YjdB
VNKFFLKSIIGILMMLVVGFFSCEENVDEPKNILVEEIEISGDYITDGGTTQLSATILPEDATDRSIEWSVSDENIAVVNQSGLLTAVSNGTVTVTAKALDGSEVSTKKLISVKGVYEPPVLVENISISGGDITDGQSKQYIADVLPVNAANREVNWSVSDELIARIDSLGLLQPLRNGVIEVIASATDGSNVVAKKEINISGVENEIILLTNLSIVGGDITDGNAKQFTVEVAPTNATNQTVTWSVSDEELAIMDSTGLLIPLKNGAVTIFAQANDDSGLKVEMVVNISGVNENEVGTIVSTATELLTAIAEASAGDVIYLRAGNYEFGSTIRLNRDGQEGNPISLFGFPGESRPVLDFSSMSESSSNRGVSLSADYWHIKGIEIYNAGDNGLNISGSNNIIEYCAFYENSDSGLQIGGGGANNTIINCDSYFNADSSIENADGFAAKLDCGSGNKFIGCRAWNNLDDGWDGYLRGADNITTYYENCWAIRNGYLKNGSKGGGDGNGFKTGGSDTKDLSHNGEFKNCIAAGNLYDGFDHNSNRGDISLLSCGAYDNGRNINFGSSNIAHGLIIKNTSSVGGGGDSYNATIFDISNNSWQNGLSATAADYHSLDIDALLAPRKADGSLPDVDFMRLKADSDLIDQGVDVGLPYNGTAPDIGPFESE